MICQIVENGVYMLLILCLWIPIVNSVREKTATIQEFCSDNSFLRNIEPGEPYRLTLKSDHSSGVNKWYQKSKRKCRQEFKTSDSAAHFVVIISDMNIPSCDNCRCNYFEISVSGHVKRFCGVKETDYFPTKSDKISIEFHHGSTLRFDVSLTLSVERNVYFITGTPKDSSESGNFIETPYFPTPYSPNYRAEYILQSDDFNSHVLLLFLDFQISHHSFIEVTGNNGTHPSRFYGDVFRPPVIVSQSNRLTLKFQSNDQPGMSGFRAISSFIKNTDSLVVPYADCASTKDGRGGYINIKTHKQFGLYDCMWHIVPFSPFSKLNLSVFTHLRNISHKSVLEFRSGHHSKSEIIREINCEVQDCYELDVEVIAPASEYLYIRFSGYLDVYSVMYISYSTYHSGDCSDKEFRCENGRCLLTDFKCDGVPHCPSGSDEDQCPSSTVSGDENLIPIVQKESFHSDNTYAYIVLLGCFGLLAVVAIVVYFIHKNFKSGRNEPVSSQAASGELSSVQPILHPMNPHDCDSPPSYEDFLKASNCFPPLLYTRTTPHFVPKETCVQCTTSFCSGARMRHHSADSCTPKNSDTNSGDIFLNIPEDIRNPTEPPSSDTYNVEIIQNNLAFKNSKNSVKRSYSLDSKLNDLVARDSCHLLLSIVHPVCTHASNIPQVQWHTLPSNFKMGAFENFENRSKVQESSWLSIDSNVNLSKDRRFSWSFVPRGSVESDLVTVVKTRCFSEPCRKISIHCSLH